MVCRAGKTTWMECKWKSQADWYRKTGQFVTGIDRRLYDHYCKVEQVSGMPVNIAFLHLAEDEVRIEKLAALQKRIHHEYAGDKMSRSGMVFWAYDDIPRLARLGELLKNAIA